MNMALARLNVHRKLAIKIKQVIDVFDQLNFTTTVEHKPRGTVSVMVTDGATLDLFKPLLGPCQLSVPRIRMEKYLVPTNHPAPHHLSWRGRVGTKRNRCTFEVNSTSNGLASKWTTKRRFEGDTVSCICADNNVKSFKWSASCLRVNTRLQSCIPAQHRNQRSEDSSHGWRIHAKPKVAPQLLQTIQKAKFYFAPTSLPMPFPLWRSHPSGVRSLKKCKKLFFFAAT